MSCSDKIAMWNCLGVQGAAVSAYIDPIHFESIVLGIDCPVEDTGALIDASERAFVRRLKPYVDTQHRCKLPRVEHSRAWPFPSRRVRTRGTPTGQGHKERLAKSSCGLAIDVTWPSTPEYRSCEVLVGARGLRQGASKNTASERVELVGRCC